MKNLSYDEIAILVALEEELPRETLPNHKIYYSGVGKINATYKTLEIINNQNPSLIINYGTAGSLNKSLKGLQEVSEFIQRDMDATELGFKVGETPLDKIFNISFGRDGVSCGTGDNFVNSKPTIMTDLVDMEAYAIAKICKLKKLEFICFKYITDSADANSSLNWKENVGSGKYAFKQKVSELLK